MWDAAGDKLPYGGLTKVVLSIGALIIISSALALEETSYTTNSLIS
jgi:hypothetical protein